MMSEDVELFRKHVQYLNDFSTADEIAQFLKEQGVQGYRRHHMVCPIAQYLQQQIGMQVSVRTGGTSIYGNRHNLDSRTHLTEPVREFIVRFDSGSYPELCVNKEETRCSGNG